MNGAQNQYADDDRTWHTNVSLPEEVLEAYMDMQNRLYSENVEGKSDNANTRFVAALFSQPAEAITEAYEAGYEQAYRLRHTHGAEMHHLMNFDNPTGTRSLTGIRFCGGGVSALAMKSGYMAFVRTLEA